MDDGSLPCLIILDVNVLVMHRKEALRQITNKQRFKCIPAVRFSTSNNILDKLYTPRLGAEFISKSVSFTDMKIIVKQLIDICKVDVKHRA